MRLVMCMGLPRGMLDAKGAGCTRQYHVAAGGKCCCVVYVAGTVYACTPLSTSPRGMLGDPCLAPAQPMGFWPRIMGIVLGQKHADQPS
jgi:hypothetical protein